MTTIVHSALSRVSPTRSPSRAAGRRSYRCVAYCPGRFFSPVCSCRSPLEVEDFYSLAKSASARMVDDVRSKYCWPPSRPPVTQQWRRRTCNTKRKSSDISTVYSYQLLLPPSDDRIIIYYNISTLLDSRSLKVWVCSMSNILYMIIDFKMYVLF